jgi:hypothetical protein
LGPTAIIKIRPHHPALVEDQALNVNGLTEDETVGHGLNIFLKTMHLCLLALKCTL